MRLASPRIGTGTVVAVVFGLGILVGHALSPAAATRNPAAEISAEFLGPVHVASRIGHATEVLRVIDGDTFEARVRVWPGLDITTKVRLRGIDAPEMRANCPQEVSQAEAARTALAAILAQGHVEVSQVGLDKHGGRVLADALTRQTPDVGRALLGTGLVRAYSGGRRDGWCR